MLLAKRPNVRMRERDERENHHHQCDQILAILGHLNKILKSIWPFLGKIFSIWPNSDSTLAIIFIIGQIFIVLNGQILNKQFSHLVTLLATRRKDENIR